MKIETEKKGDDFPDAPSHLQFLVVLKCRKVRNRKSPMPFHRADCFSVFVCPWDGSASFEIDKHGVRALGGAKQMPAGGGRSAEALRLLRLRWLLIASNLDSVFWEGTVRAASGGEGGLVAEGKVRRRPERARRDTGGGCHLRSVQGCMSLGQSKVGTKAA